MKKLFAILMVIALMCTMLVSCDDAQTLLEEADAALLEESYRMTMKMNFESDNEDLNEIFSAMNVEVPVIVDGGNMAMDMSMEAMGYTVDADFVVFDNVMYYDMSMAGQTVKMKCDLSDEQLKQFMEQNNTSLPITPENFGTLTVENKDGKKYVACGEITEDGIKELNGVIKDALAALEGEAEVKDISYGIVLDDGKYESVELSCTYSVTVGEEQVNISFAASVNYEYGDFAKVECPANPESYQKVGYGDLFGN